MLDYGSPLWGILLTAICFLAAWPLSRVRFFARLQDSSSARFTQIDGLRGYLAFAVLLTHIVATRGWYATGVWTSPKSSFYQLCALVPVSLFFIITAFLFWSKIIRSSGRLEPLPYLENRLRRLGPLYWAALSFLFLMVGFRTGWRLHDSPAHLLLSVARWLAFGVAGRPDLNGLDKTFLLNPPLWTLQYEWLFYLVLPAICRFYRPLLAAPIILGFFAVEWIFPGRAAVVVVNFGIGMTAAHLHARFADLPWLKSRAAALVALGCLGLTAFARLDTYSLAISVLVLPVFLCALYGNTFFGLTSNPAAQVMGLTSYSVYVIHCLVLLPAYQVMSSIVPISTLSAPMFWSIGLGVGLLVVGLSAVTFRLVEYPGFTRQRSSGGRQREDAAGRRGRLPRQRHDSLGVDLRK